MVAGSPAPICFATSKVPSRNSAWGTTMFTRPRSIACCASTNAPVSVSSTALRMPTARGNSALIPHAGNRPIWACVSAKVARSEAMMRSRLSASSNAPVTHAPLTASTTGLPTARMAPRIRVLVRARVTGFVQCAQFLHVDATRNAGSVPVSTTTSTVSSRSASTNKLLSSRRIAVSRRCGPRVDA